MARGRLFRVGPEVVGDGVPLGQQVLVGGDGHAVEEPGGVGVGVGDQRGDVAEVLVEGLVLLDDEDGVELRAVIGVDRSQAQRGVGRSALARPDARVGEEAAPVVVLDHCVRPRR